MRTIQKILVLILILGIGVSAIPGAAQDETGNYQLYLPILMRNYPHHPIFGVEVTRSGFMDKANLAGNHWVRYNGLLWSEVQPDSTTQYLWEKNQALEADLIAASEAGMEVNLVVRSTPSWTQKYDGYFCGPPKDLNAFAKFMSNVVKRYSIPPFNVKYFEIWNEPDVDPYTTSNFSKTSQYGCWGDLNDDYYGGGYYAEMLEAVYPAMKAANPVVNLVLGGLLLDCDPRSFGEDSGYCETENNTKAPKFFEGILSYGDGGGAYFDVVSFHGYPRYNPGESPIETEFNFSTWEAAGGVVAGKLDYIKELMPKYGIDKPIFHTEGALLLPNSESISTNEFEAAKANYLPWLYARNWAQGIQATNWYTMNGPGWYQSALLDANQIEREAYYAFQWMSQTLGKADYVSYTILANGVHRFEFLTLEKRIWLLFSPDNNSRTVTVPTTSTVYDLFGNTLVIDGDNITFVRPIYIEMSK